MKSIASMPAPVRWPSGSGSIAGSAAPTRAPDSKPLPSIFLSLKVEEAFSADAALKNARIIVETFNGVVQLSGLVNARYELDRAIQVARSTSGVHSVRNCMQLGSSNRSR